VDDRDVVSPIDNKVARLLALLHVKCRTAPARPPSGGDLDKPAPALLRAVYLPVRSAREAVDAVGVAPELAHRLARVVQPEQPPLIHSAEQHLVVGAIPDDTAGGPLERPGNAFEFPCHAALLPDRHAGDVETRAKHRVISHHAERAPIVIAPSDVGGVPTGNEQAAEQLATRVDHMHPAGPGAVDVAFAVALHAIGDARLAAGELVE